MSQWIVDPRKLPKLFIPASLDTSGMISMATLTDEWDVLFDPKTGTTHRCAEYRQQAIEESKRAPD